jgi:hypothetical protein
MLVCDPHAIRNAKGNNFDGCIAKDCFNSVVVN